MAARNNLRKHWENVVFRKAIVNVVILAILSTASGCFNFQPPRPHKMYSGPELDRSKVAFIFGQIRPFSQRYRGDRYLYIACVDGSCIEGDCLKHKIGWSHVSVLPGKHEITMCYHWRKELWSGRQLIGVVREAGLLSFELTAEAGKSYHVKACVWEREISEPLAILMSVGDIQVWLWVEDMQTGARVPI